MESTNCNINYLNVTPLDEKWGLSVTTIGYQRIPPHSHYPLEKQHPEGYNFDVKEGRVLPEYQLVYISEGSGYFESASSGKQKVQSGTMILIFPGEWHTYYPCEDGWFEYWVGFRGDMVENSISNKFFVKDKPVFEIGVSSSIISLYEDIYSLALNENPGYQQLISSMVLYMMGNIYYKRKNHVLKSSNVVADKINEARLIMKKNISAPVPVEDIARHLNVSYSWLRSHFKSFTGVSPVQYILYLRYLKAKELLLNSNMSISEIAYSLNFETVSQFSSFFTKKEGLSPTVFKKKYTPKT